MFKTTLKILTASSMIVAATPLIAPGTADAQIKFNVNTNWAKALQKHTSGKRSTTRRTKPDANWAKALQQLSNNKSKYRVKPKITRKPSSQNWAKALQQLNKNKHKYGVKPKTSGKPSFTTGKNDWAKALQQLSKNKDKYRVTPKITRKPSSQNWAKALQELNKNKGKINQTNTLSPEALEAIRKNLVKEKNITVPRGGINRQAHRGAGSGPAGRPLKGKFWNNVADQLKNLDEKKCSGLQCALNKVREHNNRRVGAGKGMNWAPVVPGVIGAGSDKVDRGKMIEALDVLNPSRRRANNGGGVQFDQIDPSKVDCKYLLGGCGGLGGGNNTQPQANPSSGNDRRDRRQERRDFVQGLVEGIAGAIAQGQAQGYAGSAGTYYADPGYVPARTTRPSRKTRKAKMRAVKTVAPAATPKVEEVETAKAVCSRPAEATSADGMQAIRWLETGGWKDIAIQMEKSTKEKTVALVTLHAADCTTQGYEFVEQTRQPGQLVTKTSRYDVKGVYLGHDITVNNGTQVIITSFAADGAVTGSRVERASKVSAAAQ